MMCTVCGCSGVSDHHHHDHDHDHGDDHDHDHVHGHGHDHADVHGCHAHGPADARLVEVERGILAKNDAHAAANRARFGRAGVLAVNLLSSPGSGKTTLLVATLVALAGRWPVAVIEGDQQTANDAERIRATGTAAVQINTGKGCHLDAHMVGHALDRLPAVDGGVLFVENVGNLVCPAGFDLGEGRRVVLLSLTEGEDKPLKYPDAFASADLVLITKTDLAPHLEVDWQALDRAIERVRPGVARLAVSARSGAGMDAWLDWLAAARPVRAAAAE